MSAIISRREARQILKNMLRKRALEEHAAELSNSTAEKRAEIMARIDRDIAKEIRLQAGRIEGDILH